MFAHTIVNGGVQPYSIAEKEIEDAESHKIDELYEFSNDPSDD